MSVPLACKQLLNIALLLASRPTSVNHFSQSSTGNTKGSPVCQITFN
jgi:hypothetical protein